MSGELGMMRIIIRNKKSLYVVNYMLFISFFNSILIKAQTQFRIKSYFFLGGYFSFALSLPPVQTTSCSVTRRLDYKEEGRD